MRRTISQWVPVGLVCLALCGNGLLSCKTVKAPSEQQARMAELDGLSAQELLARAEAGDTQAMVRIGVFYQSLKIEGISENDAVKEAVYWWEKAAEGGEVMALSNLALLYAHKTIPGGGAAYGDIPLDYEKTFALLNEAIDKGNMKAPRNLGEFYLKGEGTGKDEAKAVELFKLAADRGDSTGTLYYADALYEGRVIPQDKARAKALYQQLVKSHAHDAALAQERLDAIKAAAKSLPADKGIKKVATLAESFGDGEKVSALILTYGEELDGASVSPDDFAVECWENGQALTRSVESVSVEGKTVTLHLAYVNKWDATGGKMPPRKETATAAGAPATEAGSAEAATGESLQPEGGPRFDDDGVPVDVSARVTQTGEVRTAKGKVYGPSATVFASSESTELVLQDFTKHYFTDSQTGITLPYFVYLPAGYDQKAAYPLVFFVPDASADTSIENATLTQGNGATIWATAQEQAKHPAIVVAVQYPFSVVKEYGPLTADGYQWSQGLTAVDNLLHAVIESYAVDESRIYGTGQSQGCMTNIALSDRHPDLFAAQYLVAGQWNVEEMAAMKDKKLWIVVCEGDTKAYPGMTAAVNLWESLGAKVARGDEMWNPKADATEMQANVEAMLAKDADIRMNVFAGGSHMYTWSLAYNIEGIRDWLFAQHK